MPSDTPHTLNRAQQRAAAQRARRMETREPFEPAIYAPMPPDLEPEAIAETVTGANVEMGSLAIKAKEISIRFEKAAKLDGEADNHRLAAALQLASAEQECKERKINFKKWCAASLTQAPRTIHLMLSIGKASDPAAALAELREKNRLANLEYRARKALQSSEVPQITADRGTPPEVAPAQPQPEPTDVEHVVEGEHDGLDAQTILGALETLETTDRVTVAAHAAESLPVDEARAVTQTLAEKLGLEIVRSKGPKFHVTLSSVLADYRKLSPADQAEFLRRIEQQAAA